MSDAQQRQVYQPWLKVSSTGKNVLIVDDNPSNRKLLREILQAEGYTTVEAEDGIEGLFCPGTPTDRYSCFRHSNAEYGRLWSLH